MNRRQMRFQKCGPCKEKGEGTELCESCIHNRMALEYLTASKYSRKQLRKIAYWVGYKHGDRYGFARGMATTCIALGVITMLASLFHV